MLMQPGVLKAAVITFNQYRSCGIYFTMPYISRYQCPEHPLSLILGNHYLQWPPTESCNRQRFKDFIEDIIEQLDTATIEILLDSCKLSRREKSS